MTSQSLINHFRLKVNTELEALEEILPWFENISQGYLPNKTLWECKLALAEGFTNTVRYAHQDLPPIIPIIIEVHFFANYLKIQIWDIGPPFDLQKKLAAIAQNPVNPLEKESDRGLFFMQTLTDNLQYIRIANQRNCLILGKKFTPEI